MRCLALLGVMAAALVGCSSNGSKGADGGDSGGSDPCGAPLSQNTVCAPTFDMQVANNPCDPTADPATQSTCGKYKVWTLIVVGSDSCVYDTSNNGALVGARSCGGATDCPQGCITFGIAASQYASCGAATPACPP